MFNLQYAKELISLQFLVKMEINFALAFSVLFPFWQNILRLSNDCWSFPSPAGQLSGSDQILAVTLYQNILSSHCLHFKVIRMIRWSFKVLCTIQWSFIQSNTHSMVELVMGITQWCFKVISIISWNFKVIYRK